MSAPSYRENPLRTRNGRRFLAELVPRTFFQFVEGGVLIAPPEGHPYFVFERQLVCGFDELDPDKVFEILSEWSLEELGLRPLIVITAELYASGSPPDPSVTALSDPFEPNSDTLEAVPKDRRFSDSHHVQNITVGAMRFSALTREGVAAKHAAAEAERNRLADEAEAAQKREAEKAAAERVRKKEEQRAAVETEEREIFRVRKRFCDEWLAGTLPMFQPETLLLDMWEQSPRVGLVRYPGVRLSGDEAFKTDDVRLDDGTFIFEIQRLHEAHYAQIVFEPASKIGNHDFQGVWARTDKWKSLEVWTDRDPLRVTSEGRFIPYWGPAVPLGTRIPRSEALAGRLEPFPKLNPTKMVGIDLVGNSYNPIVGDAFTGEDALEYLRPIVGDIVAEVRRPKSEDDDGDEPQVESVIIWGVL